MAKNNHEYRQYVAFIPAGIDPGEIAHLLQDLVRNNILYFDPAEALYYPQGKSYQWGIKLYFESIL